MKNLFLRILIGALVILQVGIIQHAVMGSPETSPAHVPGELLVGFLPGAAAFSKASVHSRRGALLEKRFEEIGVDLVRLPPGQSVAAARASYSSERIVRFAEPNYLLSAHATTPDDPRFSDQWAHRNTGQTVGGVAGTPDADIDTSEPGPTPDAWDVNRGSRDVVVAVIDTGIDIGHPDLAANIWVNTGEIVGNGIDDDGNGYIDDVNGWNFADDNNVVYNPGESCPLIQGGGTNDDHGTHVAGIIGAVGNNGVGVAGVNWEVEIMPLKFLKKSSGECGVGSTAHAIEAILYAIRMAAGLMNASWGGGGQSEALRQAFIAAGEAGVLFAAAAGNGGADGIGDDLSIFPEYPASFDLSNEIVVAASTNTDGLASFSNFGGPTELAAPGKDILSTVTRATDASNPYRSFSGTSMAAPYVTGTLALLGAQYPHAPPLELKDRVLSTVDLKPAFSSPTPPPPTRTGGRLNASGAIRDVRPVIPTVLSPNGGEALAPGSITTIECKTNIPPGSPTTPYRVEYTENALASKALSFDFESGIPAGFEEPSDSEAPWTTATTSPRPGGSGSLSARSGAVADNQASWMSTTQRFSTSGTLSFWYRVSSENCESESEPVCGDYLRFYINGSPVLQEAGELPWTEFSIGVPAGVQTFSWSYQKDPLVSEGADAAWIDDVSFSGIEDVLWSPVGTTASGDTSIAWSVPNSASSAFKVRVCQDTGSPCTTSASDESDDVFFIDAGVLIDEPGGSTTAAEGGTSDTYTVVLITQPTSDVVIGITPDDQLTVSPTSLTFTSANWSTPQAVTVEAIDDNEAEGPHSGVITHSATSSDPNYDGIPIASVTVNIIDNDPQAVNDVPVATADTSGWEVLGGALGGGPDAASWASNRLDVFSRGADNSLLHHWWDGAAWHSESLGGVLTSDPTAVSWGPNRIDVFVRGTDNGMWQIFWDGTRWVGWIGHGGMLTSSPDVSSWAPGRLDVFVRGTDNALWQKFWNGSAWSGWNFLGGQLSADPTAVSWGPNRIDVFVRGTDSGMWQLFWDGSRWNGWVGHGGVLASGPDAASWDAGRLDVFVKGTDARLWYRSWAGSTWTGWQTPGGAAFLSDPGAVSWGRERMDVFVRSTDSRLLHKWFDGAWRP